MTEIKDYPQLLGEALKSISLATGKLAEANNAIDSALSLADKWRVLLKESESDLKMVREENTDLDIRLRSMTLSLWVSFTLNLVLFVSLLLCWSSLLA